MHPKVHFRASAVAALASLATVLVAAAPEADGDRFVNRAKEAGLTESTGYGKAVSIIDVNGDGWEDIWDSNTNIPRLPSRPSNSKLYLSQGDGTYRVVDTGVDPKDVAFAWGAAWADYDNDGDPDLLIASGGLLGDSSLALYENRWKEEGKLVKLPPSSGITMEKHHWWGASWADFNNDRCLDFATIERGGRAWVYRSGCDGTFTEVAHALGIKMQFKDGKNPVWFDFDNDGDPDLYLAGTSHHGLYRNDGDAGFVDVTGSLGEELRLSPTVFAAFSADLNQDGNIDLYLGRRARQDMIAFSQGDGTFRIRGNEIGIDAAIAPDVSENTMGLGAGDINEDGYIDILIGTGNPSGAFYDFIFCGHPAPRRPSGVRFERCGEFVREGHGKQRTHGIAIGDLDQNGRNDIVYNLGGAPPFDFRKGENSDSRSTNTLYMKSKANPNTATIRLEGIASNRDAIGARIVVKKPSGQKLYYSIRSAQGFQSQNSRWRLIHLESGQRAELEVRWPSGLTTHHSVASGERTVLTESEGTAALP